MTPGTVSVGRQPMTEGFPDKSVIKHRRKCFGAQNSIEKERKDCVLGSCGCGWWRSQSCGH